MIFVGWVVKTILIRLGGSTLLTRLTPLFIGPVVGECLAAGLWLMLNLAVASAGGAYMPVYFTP